MINMHIIASAMDCKGLTIRYRHCPVSNACLGRVFAETCAGGTLESMAASAAMMQSIPRVTSYREAKALAATNKKLARWVRYEYDLWWWGVFRAAVTRLLQWKTRGEKTFTFVGTNTSVIQFVGIPENVTVITGPSRPAHFARVEVVVKPTNALNKKYHDLFSTAWPDVTMRNGMTVARIPVNTPEHRRRFCDDVIDLIFSRNHGNVRLLFDSRSITKATFEDYRAHGDEVTSTFGLWTRKAIQGVMGMRDSDRLVVETKDKKWGSWKERELHFICHESKRGRVLTMYPEPSPRMHFSLDCAMHQDIDGRFYDMNNDFIVTTEEGVTRFLQYLGFAIMGLYGEFNHVRLAIVAQGVAVMEPETPDEEHETPGVEYIRF